MMTLSHQPFVGKVMQHLHQNRAHIEDYLIIFPSQLSIDYFKQVTHSQWPILPTCSTLRSLMLQHSPLQVASGLALLKILHTSLHARLDQTCSFEQFYTTGVTLLQDFNELDHYLIDPSALFLNLPQPSSCSASTAILGEATAVDAPYALSGAQLLLLYETFVQRLMIAGKGYEGLCCKMAANSKALTIGKQQLIFVGFNLLTPAEMQFILQCKRGFPTTFFWDIDAHYFNNEINSAGYYLRKYAQDPSLKETFPLTVETYFQDTHKKVEVTAMHHTLAQVQAVVDALHNETSGVQYTQTAVVISGTHLLLPLLDKLAKVPLHFRVNYPFHTTMIYTIIEKLAANWMHLSKGVGGDPSSLSLLYPLVGISSETNAAAIPYSACYLTLWEAWSSAGKTFLHYVHKVLHCVNNHYTTEMTIFLDLNRSALHHILEDMDDFIKLGEDFSVSFFLNYGKSLSIPYSQDHPGLYILEVAESHNLDFEHIFCMDMQEGAFPTVGVYASYIPYALRKCVGLPLSDQVAESTTAYGFYRLLQRAQYVYGSYVQTAHASAGMSRFLLQLIFDSPLSVIQRRHPMGFAARPLPDILIEKDSCVRQWLHAFTETRSLTPSALISYLRCPLQFYFSYVRLLKPVGRPKELALQVGMVLHQVLEKLYRPFIGRRIDHALMAHLTAKVKKVVAESVQSIEKVPLWLVQLITQLVEGVLALDRGSIPFDLWEVELGKQQPMVMRWALDDSRKVCLSGVIDRVDKQESTLRMVDYKTGYLHNRLGNVSDLFDRKAIKKHQAIFQLFFYAWLFKHFRNTDLPIFPALIHVQALFAPTYEPGIFMQQNEKRYKPIKDITPYLPSFSDGLRELLLEIFNPAIPFTQTTDRETCATCPYVRICRRD